MMPNVPNVPGVPPLLSYSANPIALLLQDAVAALLGLFAPPQWGIFSNGFPVIVADNQISFDYKQDFPISTYPVEQGQFQTYDRVQLPSEIRCRFSAGGNVTNRQNFLQSIDAVMNSGITLYDVVTPEETYLGYTFNHRDFSRTAESGVGLIVVDLWLTEVIETATAQFQNTQQPGNAGQQASGNVTPQAPSSSIQQLYSSNGGAG
jgi:hypothetical protein